MYAPLPLSPRRLGTSLRIRGKRTIKEERNYIFYYFNTLFALSAAGFFAKSHIMFFPLSSFRFCCHHFGSARRSRMTAGVNCDSLFFACCVKRKNRECKPSPNGSRASVRKQVIYLLNGRRTVYFSKALSVFCIHETIHLNI